LWWCWWFGWRFTTAATDRGYATARTGGEAAGAVVIGVELGAGEIGFGSIADGEVLTAISIQSALQPKKGINCSINDKSPALKFLFQLDKLLISPFFYQFKKHAFIYLHRLISGENRILQPIFRKLNF
jgi:hypothetical protein